MQLSHSQKHVRVVDELISWSIVPRKGFPDLARLRVAVGPLLRSWAEYRRPRLKPGAAVQWLSA